LLKSDCSIFAIAFMKKLIQYRLFAWFLFGVLLFPIGVNFGHSFEKHDNFKCHAKSVKHLHQQRISCAVFHYIVNYNAPLVSNTFTFKTFSLYHNPFIFNTVSLYKIDFHENALRAPPVF